MQPTARAGARTRFGSRSRSSARIGSRSGAQTSENPTPRGAGAARCRRLRCSDPEPTITTEPAAHPNEPGRFRIGLESVNLDSPRRLKETNVDLNDTPEQASYRQEVRAW